MAAVLPGYTLVFSDEFDQPTLDLSSWNVEIDGNGGENGEAEYYTADSISMVPSTASPTGFKGLALTIRPIVNPQGTNTADLANFTSYDPGASQPTQRWYKSGAVNTRGHHSIQYGRVDVRAQLPPGDHTWPAVWMLPVKQDSSTPQTTWPNGGEIDMMEQFGGLANGGPTRISGTLHWGPSDDVQVQESAATQVISGVFSDAFHVFSVVWGPAQIQWFVDGICYSTMTPDTQDLTASGLNPNPRPPWPFGMVYLDNSNPFYLILNSAIGGSCGGMDVPPLDNPGSFQAMATAANYISRQPQVMTIDYVHMWQLLVPIGGGGPYMSTDGPPVQPLPLPGAGNTQYYGTGTESVTAHAVAAPPAGVFNMSVAYNNAANRFVHVDLLRTSDWANVANAVSGVVPAGTGSVQLSINISTVPVGQVYVWSVWTVSDVDEAAAQPWLYKHAWQIYQANITASP